MALQLAQKSRHFSLRREKNEQKLKNEFLLYMSHKNELISANNYQNVMKPKYDVNGLYAPLEVTSDDFLKNFRLPDENFLKFHDIFIRPSKLSQKVIRSDSETL